MFSVVIPAHNEERTLARCLETLLSDAQPGELEVIVACNGCADRTAEVAGRFSPQVKVMETPTASKIVALNLGDSAANAFPRFYVDADIDVPASALRRCAEVLEAGPCLAAAPRLALDLSDCPWTVRAYYAIWMQLGYVRRGLIGSGVYGLSAAGRARFGAFPDVIADDLYVRNLFSDDERCSVEDVEFRMRPARSLADLVKRKTRVFVGNAQLAGQKRAEMLAEAPGRVDTLRRMLLQPGLLLGAPVYAYVSAMSHWKARARVRSGDFITWDRDESTR